MLQEASTNGLRLLSINGRERREPPFSDDYGARNGKRFAAANGKVHLERTAVLAVFDSPKFDWGEVSAAHSLMAVDFRLNGRLARHTGASRRSRPARRTTSHRVPLRMPPRWVWPWATRSSCARPTGLPWRRAGHRRRGEGGRARPGLLPEAEQEFIFATHLHVSSINSEFETMVVCDIVKAQRPRDRPTLSTWTRADRARCMGRPPCLSARVHACLRAPQVCSIQTGRRRWSALWTCKLWVRSPS